MTSPLDRLVRTLAAELADGPDAERRILGIAGAPGAGKSTLATLLATELGAERCVVVPMDGFHLAQRIIDADDRRERKGAIDTFDGAGLVALLIRLRARDEDVVYAPAFERAVEEPVAGAIPVPRETPLVIVEGNYLLVDEGPWRRVRGLVDAVWFVEPEEAVRRRRLVERHVRFGKPPAAAAAWTDGPDAANAALVRATRERADRVIPWP